jgi:FixJ family two-component response regulator
LAIQHDIAGAALYQRTSYRVNRFHYSNDKQFSKVRINMKNSTVAVVENDVAILTAIGRLLRAMGYLPELYESAEQFLNRSSPAQIDCLLLDIDLGGMSGIELQKKLVSANVAPPIVFVTSQSDEPTIAQAIDEGCVAYLHKPFEAQSLLRALQAAEMRQMNSDCHH